MLYHTYWRCCGHSAAGLAVGLALVTAGVVGLARVAIVLPNSDDDAGKNIGSFLPLSFTLGKTAAFFTELSLNLLLKVHRSPDHGNMPGLRLIQRFWLVESETEPNWVGSYQFLWFYDNITERKWQLLDLRSPNQIHKIKLPGTYVWFDRVLCDITLQHCKIVTTPTDSHCILEPLDPWTVACNSKEAERLAPS